MQAGILPQGLLPFSNLLVALTGSCLFSAFLAYHTKLIVGGKNGSNKYQMNDKDYVLAAMALYSDIVQIFLNLLELFEESG